MELGLSGYFWKRLDRKLSRLLAKRPKGITPVSQCRHYVTRKKISPDFMDNIRHLVNMVAYFPVSQNMRLWVFVSQPLKNVQTTLSVKGVPTQAEGRVWLGEPLQETPDLGQQRRPSLAGGRAHPPSSGPGGRAGGCPGSHKATEDVREIYTGTPGRKKSF